MEALYHETNRTIQEIQQCFQQLNSVSQANAGPVENQIAVKITAVNANCDRLDVLVLKVPVSQRSSAKVRVDQLKYDARHLATALQNYQHKKQRIQQDLEEREALLSRRFTPNAETSIDIDFSLQHHTAMGNAHQGVDEMLHTGHNVLGNLRSQRDTLKGAHKRILDIGNTLGLSNHTMRLIERRIQEDKYVVFGGMAATTLFIFLVVWYFVL